MIRVQAYLDFKIGAVTVGFIRTLKCKVFRSASALKSWSLPALMGFDNVSYAILKP